MARIGVIHYNFPGFSFEAFLDYAMDAGFSYVELQCPDVWPQGDDNPEARAEQVRKEVDRRGLEVSALAAHNDFVQPNLEAVQFQVARMKRVAGLARILGDGAVLRSEGGQPKDSVPQEKWLDAMVECFSRCTSFVDDLKVGIAIDNHGLITNDGDLLFAVIRKVGHPLIGSNLDTMNFRWFGADIQTCNRYYETLAPYTLHTHMKDGFDSRGSYRGAALGEGEIDLAHALDCLRKAGYQGVYTAEYEGPEVSEGLGYRKCGQWLHTHLD